MTFSTFISGKPAPQGSKRHVGNGRMVEASKKLPAWRKTIIDTLKQEYDGEPLDGPVKVDACFYLNKPQKPLFSKPATAPDLDKLCRALGDGLEQSGVLKNDSRITAWQAQKKYATNPQTTGVYITIRKDD